jgi:uncharacterized surface protein with fasciclin (FAS1) repeats
MFDQGDLRGPLPHKETCPTTLSGIIARHPDFTHFNYLIKLANLEALLNEPEANLTLFVPSDMMLNKVVDPAVFLNMDLATARHVIFGSALQRKITSAVLEDSPASWMNTRDPVNRLFVTTVHGRTKINNSINVIHKDMQASNGLIHVVDNLIFPIIA